MAGSDLHRIEVTSEAVPHLGWPGLAQIARLTRTRETGGKTSTKTVYLITSLPTAAADPARLLALSRAHWGIENKLHHVRDVSMDEDRCRVRAGARALASVRNATLAIIRRGLAVPEARENFREDRADYQGRDRLDSLNGPARWLCVLDQSKPGMRTGRLRGRYSRM